MLAISPIGNRQASAEDHSLPWCDCREICLQENGGEQACRHFCRKQQQAMDK
jgi:hypothetical protein